MTLLYKQNKIAAIEQLENSKLSIQLSLDGFSFCVIDMLSNKIVGVFEVPFEKSSSNHQELLEQVQFLFSELQILKNPFETVTVIHSNNLATLVPKPLFTENNARDYLQYTIKTLDNDFIATDLIETADMVATYIPFVNVNNFLFEKFNTFEYKHIATVLVEQLVVIAKNNATSQFFVHFQKNEFQIIVIAANKLLFYNSFTFSSKEDVIYYILFTAEQLGLSPEDFSLVLLGAIKKDSSIYQEIYTYVRHVSFLETTYPMHESLETIAVHQLFTLRKNS